MKVTPPGSVPLSLRVGAGKPVAVTVKLALPVDEFIVASVQSPSGKWRERFHALLERCEVICQDDRLGPPQNREAVFARRKRLG